jgi:hypothetical protein
MFMEVISWVKYWNKAGFWRIAVRNRILAGIPRNCIKGSVSFRKKWRAVGSRWSQTIADTNSRKSPQKTIAMIPNLILSIITAAAMSSTALLAEEAKPDCSCMADMHKKMEAKMKADDAEISALVDEMNASTGEKKTAAMAAIINKLVLEKKAMQEKMAAMNTKTADDKKPDGDSATPPEHHH